VGLLKIGFPFYSELTLAKRFSKFRQLLVFLNFISKEKNKLAVFSLQRIKRNFLLSSSDPSDPSRVAGENGVFLVGRMH